MGVRKIWAWGLVALQFALLAALVFLPTGSLWLRGVFVWLVVALSGGVALVLGIAAGRRLGFNLTPNPIPKPEGTLETGGVYAHVRHPIYTAVLALGIALVALGASWLHLAGFFLLVMLLQVKARAEERLLRERFPDYVEYQARAGRFIPGIGRVPL